MWCILDGDGDHMNFGCTVIIPSTFTGGPCYMQSVSRMPCLILGNMVIADLFITTTTTNPNWPEIKDNLLMQEPHDLVLCWRFDSWKL